MAHTTLAREVLQAGAYKDKTERYTLEFTERPNMAQIVEAVKANHAFWDDELPQGAFLLPHVYSLRMERRHGKYNVTVEVNTPFND